LNFDGSTIKPNVRRFEPKNIPEHLVRPAIDEETLIRLKATANRPSQSPSKKMSLGAQKKQQAEMKRRKDI
jgi:hypothetical protein